VDKVRQHPLRHADAIFGQIVLGDSGVLKDDAVGMRDANAVDFFDGRRLRSRT
jgi:hypothetical protein